MKNTIIWSVVILIMSILITLEAIPNIGLLQYLNFYLHPVCAICIGILAPFIFAFASIILYILTTFIVAAIISKVCK